MYLTQTIPPKNETNHLSIGINLLEYTNLIQIILTGLTFLVFLYILSGGKIK